MDDADNFLPDIYQYLERNDNHNPITTEGLEELIGAVRAYTGLSKPVATNLVQVFFSEIRNSMLRGEVVTLPPLGRFFIASPKVSNNKKQIFARLEVFPLLLKKLNHGF